MKPFKILLLGIFLYFPSFAQYASPLDIPLYWSGSFGELREDHFHGGIDFRTQQKEGLPVFSIDSGYIFKLEISPKGYGKVLYVRHPYGLISLYAHLSAFTPYIDSLLKSKELQNDSMVSLDLTIPVGWGELIAYSGNTGSSQGPHLHFELRDSSNTIQLNPCLFGFTTQDTTPPQLEKLKFYDLNRGRTRTYKLVKTNNLFHLKRNKKVKCQEGKYAFGLQSIDKIEDLPFSYGLYSLEFKIDSTIIYSYVLNNIAIESSGLLNDHIDHPTYVKSSERFERTHSQYKDSLSIVNIVENDGVVNIQKKKSYILSVTAKDFNGNTSILKCTILGRKKKLFF